ncbi:DUF222 domain-containing protein [Microbacterium sp. LS_15]|uniref:HNH endonuclease signature motif containing protein n=1 Tax=Microbacterium sp. LS_15 TaxID=3055790 RepID=UPI0035C0EE31
MNRRSDLDLDLEERQRLLDAWTEKRRRIAILEAEASELLIERIAIHDADVAESPFHRESIYRSMLSEYSAAAHLSRGTAEQSFTDARTLSRDLPSVRAAITAGTISIAHVREIVRVSTVVAESVRNGGADAETLALFETAVLVVAEQDTAARTRAHARQVASALVGETVVERHRRATDERCVSVRSVDDGLALLTAVLPEWIAVAIADRLTRLAREVVRGRDGREPVLPVLGPATAGVGVDELSPDDPRLDSYEHGIIRSEGGIFTTDPLTDPRSAAIEHLPSDERTLDQIRADLLADLLLAAIPSEALGTGLDAIHPRIQVTVAASTLAGADDRPAELDGYGPLDPDIARALAGRHTGWSRLFLDPSGLVVESDTYTPTEAMRRFLRARDQHCRFPGCRMPVHRCEIDHNHDHARGGRTRLDNLSHLCTTHHSLKQPDVHDRHRWTAQQGPGGEVTWTSPLGREYTDPPRRRVMFV